MTLLWGLQPSMNVVLSRLTLRLRRAGPSPLSAALIFGLAIMSLVAIFAIFIVTLYISRLDVADAARTSSMNIAAAVSREFSRNIEVLDLSLQDVRDGAQDVDVDALPGPLRQIALFDRVATAHGLGALLFLNPEGQIVEQAGVDRPSPLNLSAQAFFQVHVQHPDVGLFVSRVFVSLLDGELSIALSRRVERSGRFAGVAVATIRLSYFKDFLNSLNLGPQSVVMLVAEDGSIIVRDPVQTLGSVGSTVPDALLAHLHDAGPGEFEAVSAPYGVRRTYSYNRIGTLPLVSFVGRSVDATYALWWRRAELTGLAMLLLGGTIFALIAVLQVELRRRALAEAELDILAKTDKLTGLANRRKFDDMLDVEWRRTQRNQQPLALLLLDIDHFKAFNDLFGHQGGDSVLAALGAALRDIPARSTDLAARYGGEEFAILLPGTEPSDAVIVGERIRAKIGAMRWSHPASSKSVLTVSIGVAVAWPARGGTAADLLRQADLGLYAAKAAGRDTLVFHDNERLAA